MSISETKNQRSVSLAPKESHQITIFSKQETQWKKTSKVKTSPSATFGKEQRNSKQKRIMPGPGAYELNKTTLQKGFVAFKGNKILKFYTDSPGPAAYQPKHIFPTKKFSFEKSQFYEKNEPKPSPTTYNLKQSRSIGLSFTKQERKLTPQRQKLLIPGPGKYQSNKKMTHKNQFSFTRTKKFFQNHLQQQEKEVVPGPAAYEYETSKSRHALKNIKFSKAIRSFLDDNKHPGPGTYNLNKSCLEAKGGVISAQKRLHDYDNEVPGPGNYKDVPIESIKRKDVAFVIGRSRQSSDHKQKIPGPGSYYNSNSRQKILGGSIGKDLRSNRKQIIVPNLSHTTHIFYGKESKHVDAVDNQKHFLSQTVNKSNAFEGINID